MIKMPKGVSAVRACGILIVKKLNNILVSNQCLDRQCPFYLFTWYFIN